MKLFVYLDEGEHERLIEQAARDTGGNVSLLCRAYLNLGRAAWEMLDDRGRRDTILASRRMGRPAGVRGQEAHGLPGHPAEAGSAA